LCTRCGLGDDEMIPLQRMPPDKRSNDTAWMVFACVVGLVAIAVGLVGAC